MLPKIPYKMAKNQRQTVALRGINYSNMITDGDMADSKNISARSYPYITTRKARRDLGGGEQVTAMTVFQGKIVLVRGTDLVYDNKVVGTVTAGEKQFAVINTKLVIMPDKVYLDGQTEKLCDMGASLFSKNAVFTKGSVALNNTSYAVASGKGSFVGNTFTAGTEQIWKHGVKYFTDNRLLFFANMQFKVAYSNSIIVSSIPNELRDRLKGQYFKGYFNGKTLEGTIESTWTDKDGLNIKLSGVSDLDTTHPNQVHQAEIHFFDVVKTNDELTFDIGSETKVRARVKHAYSVGWVGVSCALEGIDAPVEDITVSESDIKKEIFPDLRNLFEVGWDIGFSNNTPGMVTSVTHNTLTIDVEFTESTGVNTTITRLGSGVSAFRVGDYIMISNATQDDNNITFRIDKIDGNTVYAESDIFAEGEDDNIITVERKIPDLDLICESDNRIWGCSNTDNTIYASALGDPTNFFDYSGESTDSYAVAVGSPDKFTACCRYGGGVLFFKEMKLHKVLGSYPAEYTLYSYDIEGVQDGCAKSLQIINEVLYYKGVHGVFAFNGSPNLISANLGEKEFNKAVAGHDGDTYYLSMNDGQRGYLFAYETKHGLWVLEDDLKVSDFAKANSLIYMLCEDGKFYLCGTGDSEKDIEWFVQFTPFYETIEGRKSYSRIVMRLELPQGSRINIDVRADGGAWREVGKVIGKKEGVVPVSVPINRCDKFEIRLRGKGKCTIHQVAREFFVGGDK